MENKKVGFIIIGIGIIVSALALIFNFTLKKIVSATCTHGSSCSMYDTMSSQLWISLVLAGIILAIGLVMIFSKPYERIIVKKEKQKKNKIDKTKLDLQEKRLIDILEKEGAIFQATLMEKLGIGKVGITRLLDKLEAKQLIERKRRGMNNIVVLKN